jgi:hypothetical protein
LGVVNSKVVGNINSEGSLRIDRSTLIEGKIFVADMTTSIGASQVGDPVTVTGLPPTTVTCVDDYNASYAPLNSICQ